MKPLFVAFALFTSVLIARPAHAQIDPGYFWLYQGGQLVGHVYVPGRPPGTTIYLEHWVLTDRYAYPNPTCQCATTLVPATTKFANEEEFFAKVPWGPGYRYVLIDAKEASQLPNGR